MGLGSITKPFRKAWKKASAAVGMGSAKGVALNLATGGLYGTGKSFLTLGGAIMPNMPKYDAGDPAPVDNSEALKNAARLEAERMRKRKGMKSTILTQGMGSSMEQLQKAELMGG